MEQPQQQQQQQQQQNPTGIDQKHRKKMGKLRDTILAQLKSLNPSKPITHDVVSLIEQRLQHMFPTLHTPTHYPYASMIRRAIVELNEEGGSSEEEISEFIIREYEGLPWGHASLLTHHLRRLCGNGEILINGNRRYMIQIMEEQEEIEQHLDKYNGLKEEQIEVVEDRNVSLRRVPLGGESPMPAGEEEKESLKPVVVVEEEEQQHKQRQSRCGGRKLIVVCGLLAQQQPKEKICDREKVTESHPEKISGVLELPIEPLRLEQQQQQQQIELSSIRGLAELEVTTTLEELTQRQWKQAMLFGGKEVLKSLPKGMETPSYVHMNSEPELPVPGVSPDLKLSLEDGKKLPQAQQQQQTQGQLKQKPLRLRIRGPSKPVSATATTMAASLLFQHQHEQQQAPQHQGRKTPPIPEPQTYVNTNMEILTPSNPKNYYEQQLPKRRGRGRPRKAKRITATTLEELLPPQNQDKQQQPQSRGRGRPPKLKSDSDTVNEDLLTSQNKQQ